MGIQINGSTDRITAIDGTIDFVSNIGNIGLITASRYELLDSLTIGAGSTVIKTVNGKLLLGSTSASNDENFRIHTGSSSKAIMKFTNTTTGTAAGDGFEFGLGSDEVVEFWNKENTDIKIATNNTERLRIDSNGLIANNNRNPSSYGSPNLLISGTDSTLTLMGDGSSNSSSFTGIKFRVAGASQGDYTKAGIFSRREGGYNDLSLIFALDTVADATSVSIADEKMRITSSGQVLIGINNAVSSDVNFQLHSATSGTGPIFNMTNDSGDCRIFFGQDSSGSSANAQGQIRYNVGSNYLSAYTSGSERLRITGDGPHLLLGGSADVNEITESSANAGLVIGGTGFGNGGLAIINSTTGAGRIYFGDATGSNAARQRGQINYYHSGDYMMFATAGSERLRIDSVGRHGINVTNTGDYYSASDDLIIREKDGGDSGITIRTGTANSGLICFADGASSSSDQYRRGQIRYHHNSDSMDFTTAGNTARMTIDTNGMSKFTRGSTGTVAHFYANARESNILIQNDAKTWKIVNYDYGNNGTDHLGFHDGSSDRLIIHDDGEGISFNGNLSTNNCLGDYEKGTWSATMYGANSGTGTLFSYSTRVATYVRIGRMCFARLYYVISNRNSATGNVVIGGLPFSNASNYSYCPGIRADNIGSGGTNGADVAAYSGDGWSTWYLTYGTNSGTSGLDCSQLNNNSTMLAEFVYEIWNG